MIKPEFIEKLIERVDLVSLIAGFVELRKTGTTLEGICPFHEEKSPSFKVYPATSEVGHYYCFGCNKHGNALSFAMERIGLSFGDAVKYLAQREGLRVEYERKQQPEESKRDSDEQQARQRTLSVLRKASGEFYRRLLSTEAGPARDELNRRGIEAETILRYSLGYAPDAWNTLTRNFTSSHDTLIDAGLAVRRQNSEGAYDFFRNRLMFPIYDIKGSVVAFGGRKMAQEDGLGPKYLNSPETIVFKKGAELFGLYQAKDAVIKSGEVVVAEGYFDVITPAQHGISNVVSTCGTALTEGQLSKLLRIAKRITFCFDGDTAGHKATWRAAEMLLSTLTDEHEIRFCTLPATHDPDSLVREQGPDAFTALLRDSPTLAEYVSAKLIQKARLTSPEGKTAFIKEAIRYWRKFQAPVLAFFFRKHICTAVGIQEEEFDFLVSTTQRKAA